MNPPARGAAAELRAVGAAFGLGQPIAAAPHGSGHIHDTYRVLFERAPGGEALLQRINERDMKMLAVDRNVPESLRLAARKYMVKGLK